MLTPFYCFAADFPNESNVPGGLVHIPVADSYSEKPRVLFQGKKVLVVNNEGKWTAILGIPLSIQPGRHKVAVKSEKAKIPVLTLLLRKKNIQLNIYDTKRTHG